jgi:site-specific DNA-methyltransferase (adenine-specific)
MIFFDQDNLQIVNDDVTKTTDVKPESVDLVVTSPPYCLDIQYGECNDNIPYEDYLKFSEKWLERSLFFLKDTGRICLNIPFETAKYGKRAIYADLLNVAKKVGFNHYTTAIWTKGNCPRAGWGTWLSPKAPLLMPPAEAIIIMCKGEWKKKDCEGKKSDITKDEFVKWADCVWSIPTENRVRLGHPAPFKPELPHRCIKLLSFVGDTVLDPFNGSGSTMIAAYRNGRKAIGVDLDPKYCDLAKRRLLREIRLKKSMIF